MIKKIKMLLQCVTGKNMPQRQLLVDKIEDILHDMRVLEQNLYKATANKAANQRCRVITILLEKQFHNFRKISLDYHKSLTTKPNPTISKARKAYFSKKKTKQYD